jgi:hypothetical protein
MPNKSSKDPTSPLSGIAVRYPEKTFYLAQAFNDTTNSYKFVWFLSILSLLKRSSDSALQLAEVFAEMAVISWHPVCLYRLSFGRQDKFQDTVVHLRDLSRLPTNAESAAIRTFVLGSPDALKRLSSFKRYVSTRFLAPWFSEELKGLADSKRGPKIEKLARQSQSTPFAAPYWFDGGLIRLNPSWRAFLIENIGIVQAFAEHHFAKYLQARNPNVPGVVNKLHAPTTRQLAAARAFWNLVRTDFEKSGKLGEFRDIYSDRQLDGAFSIDHFLPWSFVAHDLFWNLTPVEQATNASKNDVLPDLDLYLPRLAKLHFAAINSVVRINAKVSSGRFPFLEDYADCFKADAAGLLRLGESGFSTRYREVILPQAQIAINQGFQFGWKMRSAVRAIETRLSTVANALSNALPRTNITATVSPGNIIEVFPTKPKGAHGATFFPFFTLEVAAGEFMSGDAPNPEGWIDAVKYGFSRSFSKEMFVTKVVGESMHPTIRNGSYCVFRSPVVGSRQGLAVLVEKRDYTDPETGGAYTVKRYRSTKSNNEDGWSHESIELIPDNPDRERFPVLAFTPEDDSDLRVIAEFIQMLETPKGAT